MKVYRVRQYVPHGNTEIIEVPASKSILNRALLLAAISDGDVLLKCGAYGEDTRAMLGCLQSLGIKVDHTENGLFVHGCGDIPNKNAELDVMSAGTAARFITTLLAFCGGEYHFRSSEQMERRPMEHLKLLEDVGVRFEYEKQPYHFPFRMISSGICADTLTVNTDESTQYASGILMAASLRKKPFKLSLTGSRTNGSYISITLSVMQAFGIPFTRTEREITIGGVWGKVPAVYAVEPDLSGACYFFALSLLLKIRILVKDVKRESIQGDIAFLRLLKSRGVRFEQTESGLLADGTTVKEYAGFEETLKDFSDQALTVAALAPFASTPSVLKDVGHIRAQECDRIAAICDNLTALGVPTRAEGDNISIFPAPVTGGTVHTFNDHRVAMAFALIGLKTGNVTIENPDCCKKTFENYFELITRLTN